MFLRTGRPVAERQFGPYRLVRQIAVGGMAEIHLAKTKGIAGFEKYVALKMIHPNFAEDDQFIQMLVDEAKIAVQLNHGNIAQTFDLGRVGETFYITMEYVDGADLYKLLRRGSEIDLEMPLDVCAFVVKEVASALDHAHRKRDHNGKSLGIVHRDVSPQNVLISYAGEVKLVDFGIAKATMKARQTAVGVIKGKYYYMSPEQAWGDPIDLRSDIFSAGIVLYEMITGQMLYLEEDLHKLLDMARRADIASPSTLRKGIPPQLERIVMHALAKVPGERYQNAGDFATDLERFLHTYSPVFTAGKVAALMRKIVGDPLEVPNAGDAPDIEIREGPIATHTLNTEDLVHSSEELRDENSMIFSMDQLQGAPAGPPAGPGRITRQAELPDLVPPKPPAAPKLPTPAAGSRALPRAPTKPRDKNEMTREVSPVPPGGEESGLLDVKTPPTPWQDSSTHTEAEELENINERTMVTGAPGGGFMMDVATEDGGDATIIGDAPTMPERDDSDDDLEDQETLTGQRPVRVDHDGDGVTTTRDFRDAAKPRTAAKRSAPAPPALAAKIHAPAVSELRKPRASRKTPASGTTTPPPNVLHQIVGAQASEAMPVPRSQAPTQPPPLPIRAPDSQPPPFGGYAVDASGLPLTTPPPGTPAQMIPGVPPHLQPYALQQGYPQTYAPPYQGYQQAPVYQLHPYGAPPPQPMSLTGQMRLFEADELPSQYKVSGNASRWVMLVLAGIVAVSVAAGVTFFIIRSSRNSTPATGSIHVESVPPGGEIFLDGTHVAGVTPQTLPFELQAGTRHEIRVELAKHKPHVENVDIPNDGGEVAINALMDPITGRLRVVTTPAGADVILDGTVRGRTPTTINDIDMASAKHLELRLKEYSPYIQTLTWPANGEIDIDQKLAR
ncbi:MAG TPA: protein kinase [Kofleriaceae bacterium]|nr:protein kinase [Kofleriaceae bacterium]